jgi:hypothetical protein
MPEDIHSPSADSPEPLSREAVYAWLRAQVQDELPPLPDKNADALIKEDGAQRLSDFIDDL